ncbi:CaiB/BaiF CoA transferase family protein [Hydrogenophaga laconesensis]|uniref:Crotonobetainyl-CoA:carnitine CoA-transferase CaiB-like acyl-CoA transferase n=1 Tax=Hydrogenophaga laconesensis TaxID=1805971 RepID=A0ABU1VIZ7_9BURK|nr:CoA transferase [Hydrogenophaga laconesensis]MDR7097458.1 crotonobetainyl-CoA:carnitine CoA-transferase CaiB-like acyl-CoA transferase [Hydrogenophaga laconesensis]
MKHEERPLQGMRVMDFTMMMAGPYCTRILADLGAEVIKVEAPDGDQIRKSPPLRAGASAYFAQLNAGKQSMSLDLKHPEAVEIAAALCEKADVVVQSFRPGVMDRLGLGFEKLAEINHRLVYCSISGFGQSGPEARRPAFAQIAHAMSGFDHVQMLYQRSEQPPNVGLFIGDLVTGLYAAIAVQAALLKRTRSGQGEHLDVTLMESMLNMMPYELQEAQFPQEKPRFVYRPLKAADGFVMVVTVTPTNVANLCDAIGRPEWKSDARFNNRVGRGANWEAFCEGIEAWTSLRTAAECEALLTAAGVPCSRYRTVVDSVRDPHLHERQAFSHVQDGGGELLVSNLPFQISGSRPLAGQHVPALGEHSRQILVEQLGLDEAGWQRLLQQGVLGQAS